MTCIAGIAHQGHVYIGADSAGVSGWDLCVRADRKIFRNGAYLFGCTTSFRMIQLLQYRLQVTGDIAADQVMAHMCTTFVDALRECFKAGGFAKKDGEAEKGGDFLVGFSGRLFRICDDYQVAESSAGYDAVGCGENIARGALYATRDDEDQYGRIELALRAAESHSAGVRGPFHYAALDDEAGAHLPDSRRLQLTTFA
jgi:hypothetical protein